MAVAEQTQSEIIDTMAVYRDAFYRSLSTFETFGRRDGCGVTMRTKEQALEMVTGPKC